mgnify:CR=1 FL=1
MPTKYRDPLADACAGKMVATIHIQAKCLSVYPYPVWEDIEAYIQDLPALKPQVARMQRLLLGYATEIDLDASGRLLLAQPLRDYASLDKKVVLVGQGKKLELWSEVLWNAECEACFAQAAHEPLPEELYSIPF